MNRRQIVKFAAAGCALGIPALQAANTKWTNARWQSAQPLPIQTQELYPCTHQGELFVAGGIAAKLGVPYFTNACFAFNPSQNVWREVAPLPADRHHAALVSNGTRLFCIGGFAGSYSQVWQMTDTVYELTDSGWQLVGRLPMPQAEGVLAYHATGDIHLVSGQNPIGTANSKRSDHRETTQHWVWDTQADAWQNAEPIPTPRNSATGGWIGDQLVVTGGRTAQGNLDVTQIYDKSGDHWHSGAPMPLPQAGTASVVLDNGLLVFGGEIFSPEPRVFANVWYYDLVQDRWHPVADMPTPRHGLGAGLLGDSVYVVGGATKPGGAGTSDLNEVLLLAD